MRTLDEIDSGNFALSPGVGTNLSNSRSRDDNASASKRSISLLDNLSSDTLLSVKSICSGILLFNIWSISDCFSLRRISSSDILFFCKSSARYISSILGFLVGIPFAPPPPPIRGGTGKFTVGGCDGTGRFTFNTLIFSTIFLITTLLLFVIISAAFSS